MQQLVLYTLFLARKQHAKLSEAVRQRLPAAVLGKYEDYNDSCELRVPVDRCSDVPGVDFLVKDGLVLEVTAPMFMERVYSKADVAGAAVFECNFLGNSMDAGENDEGELDLQMVISLDESSSCGKCGAGYTLAEEAKLPSAELRGCKRGLGCAQVGNNQLIVLSETFIGAIEKKTGTRLPVGRVVPVGRAVLKERWFFLRPHAAADPAQVADHCSKRLPCPACGAVYEQHTGAVPNSGYHTLSPTFAAAAMEPVVHSPFWDGDRRVSKAGRTKSVPWRRLWVRGDVGRAMLAAKVYDLGVEPLLQA